MNETWEYKYLGVVKMGKNGSNIEEVLNDLGKQGWEVISLEPIIIDFRNVWLKRRLN